MKRNALIILALIALLTTAAVYTWTLAGGDSATVNCTADQLLVSEQMTTSVQLDCVVYTPTVTSTPTATATPVPTATATAKPTPIAPFADAELCPTHDPVKWHGQWDYVRGCYFTHSHGSPPSSVDDIFGPLLYGQEISYPWQTFVGADSTYKPMPTDPALTEAVLKHEGYIWRTDSDVPCLVTGPCIRAFRIVAHIVPHKIDATIRFHSFWLESLICWGPDHATCGIIRNGGWADYGTLSIDNVHYPLPNDPTILPNSSVREHRWNGGTYLASSNRGGTWYGKGGIASFATFFETLSALEPDTTLTEHFFCPAYGPTGGDPAVLCQGVQGIPSWAARQNGSNYAQHIIGYNLKDNLDGVIDGIVNFNGYTDRHGKVNIDCVEIGLDCVPFVIQGIPAGPVQFNDSPGQGMVEMDGPAVSVGQYWLRYTLHGH